VEISLEKIRHNLEILIGLCLEKGIRITPVTKGVYGSVEIARLFSEYNIHSIGDSHIQNIHKMKDDGISTDFLLLREPMKHEIEDVVTLTNFCLVSEMAAINWLNDAAARYDKKYNIILMIELGDRREGILLSEIDNYIQQILSLKHIYPSGIGTNLTCLNGIKPTSEKMNQFSEIASHIQSQYSLKLDIVSGGNSANYQWLQEIKNSGKINHLRIGEAILLGIDPISQSSIRGLQTGTFLLSVEVIESKRKPSLPDGTPTYTAFGDLPKIKDEGKMNRALLAIGLQDLDLRGCSPVDPNIKIVGATSDHMVINSTKRLLQVGEIIKFSLRYRSVLRLMISPYVHKEYK